MLSIGFVMGFVGVAVALLIAILIYSEVDSVVECPIEGQPGFEACQNAKGIAYIVIGILPIAMFFILYTIFGGIGGTDEDERPRVTHKYNRRTGRYDVTRTVKSKPTYVEQDPHINDVGSMLGEVIGLFRRGKGGE